MVTVSMVIPTVLSLDDLTNTAGPTRHLRFIREALRTSVRTRFRGIMSMLNGDPDTVSLKAGRVPCLSRPLCGLLSAVIRRASFINEPDQMVSDVLQTLPYSDPVYLVATVLDPNWGLKWSECYREAMQDDDLELAKCE